MRPVDADVLLQKQKKVYEPYDEVVRAKDVENAPTIDVGNATTINDVSYQLEVYIETINEEIDKAIQCIARQEGILSALNIEYARLNDLKKILDGGKDNA